MSGRATINLVDDEEMSLQGNVNAPIATPRIGSPIQMPTTHPPQPLVGFHSWHLAILGVTPVQTHAPKMQSSMFACPSGITPTVPVTGQSAPSAIAQTIPLNTPTHEKTKESFTEVSSAF